MKINWGTGIAIFFTLFVVILVITVIRSTQYDHSLVVDEYYEQDINYQEHYQKKQNAQNLAQDLTIVQNFQDKTVTFTFPGEVGKVTGNILFFRPSNQKLDFNLPIELNDEKVQVVPIENLLPGLWKVKVDWEADGRKFYKEDVITR